MAYTGGSLAAGQMAATETSMYVATGVKALVQYIHLQNVGTSTETVDVYVKRSGGTSRSIYHGVLVPNAGVDVLSGGAKFWMSASDDIRGKTTTATTVDYTITGATE